MQTNRVVVYLEGPSDVKALDSLLALLKKDKETDGIKITFTTPGVGGANKEKFRGDGQDSVVKKIPAKAALQVLNDPYLIAVAMPDLYPPIKVGEELCTTFEQLESTMRQIFAEEICKKANPDVLEQYQQRFKVFCFKHDLEVLLLASEKQLAAHLGVKKFSIMWQKEVEDQNHDNPPKRIIEKLFEKERKKYKGPYDAALILSKCKYQEIAEKCPQQFKPFVDFLESLERTDYGSSDESGETELEEKA